MASLTFITSTSIDLVIPVKVSFTTIVVFPALIASYLELSSNLFNISESTWISNKVSFDLSYSILISNFSFKQIEVLTFILKSVILLLSIVISSDASFPLLLIALIVTVPAFRALTNPLSTVATVASLDIQVTS